MQKNLLFVPVLLLMFTVQSAYGFATKGQDCSKCHTLNKQQAAALLKKFDPNIKILNVGRSEAKYLWRVSIESKGEKGLVYIDLPKKYLFSGSLIEIQGKKNLTRENLSELNKVDVSKIPLNDALVLGSRMARHRVIVFDDPECPFCARLYQEMKKVVKERKDIAFYIKMFPLKMHPGAYEKAKAIVCEKSLALLDSAFEKKPVPPAKCKTSVVDENIKLGEKLGITGAPTLVLPDGRVMSGYRDAKSLKELIDRK